MATSPPWFLDVLGLSAYADTPAVKRAYAQALRTIDPAENPEAFARLREAYEAARAWCEQADVHPVAVAEPMPVAPDIEEHGDDATARDADARQEAALLGDAFVAEARTSSADDAVAALERTVASLRTRYVDAPGEFEERLIVLLANEALPHRAMLFDTAARLFQWQDIGQTDALGPGGRWIEQVFTQRAVWLQLAESRRKQWLALIARISLPVEPRLVRYWPEVEKLCRQYPLWIGLHLDSAARDGWRAAFEALPPSTQADFRKSGATAEAYRPAVKKPRRRFRLSGYGYWILAWVAFQIIRAIVNAHGGDTASDTPESCHELHARLSKPDAFVGLSPDEVEDLKKRGTNCLHDGYWESP